MAFYPVYTSSQALALDRVAIRDFGFSGFDLMTKAGKSAYTRFKNHWPDCKRIAVLCGAGNNGGDGYIFAAMAQQDGKYVHVYRLAKPKSPEAISAFDLYSSMGGQFSSLFSGLNLEKYDAFVDALFGVGLTREIGNDLADLIKTINSSGKTIMALDIPSGLDGNTGNPKNISIRATGTVTFMALKLGLMTGQGGEYCGWLETETLGLPNAVFSAVESEASLIDENELSFNFPRRSFDAHKGTSGRVLIVGGNKTMEGAALMSGQAAYRAGAGLVSIAMKNGLAETSLTSMSEIRHYDLSNMESLNQLLVGTDVIGVGPGLGQDDWAFDVWNEVSVFDKPLVVDADALNLLANAPVKNKNWILTPHPGEAARLLNTSVREVQSNRLAAAREIVNRFGGICVLKGAGSLIVCEKETWVCDRGNPALAVGGTGDILTGVIAALKAQGLSNAIAARCGVWVHAAAADACARNDGMIGMIATDLLPEIRKLINRLSNGPKDETSNL